MTDQATTALLAPAVDPNADMIVRFFKRGEVWLGIALMTILTVLVLPIPPLMVDFGLAISITFAVTILMTVLFIGKPLEFSVFPTVLLIATLLGFSLNLGTTRLVLMRGNEGTEAAGHVVQSFASLVMGGDFIIGVIVFGILTIVNFVVITKGSGRIAEVAARFTLDAMPGKQMAIDADLSSGLINEDEARRRRKDLEDESNFFGSMDGAAKFVRGDAIAGLIITFINGIGGIVIGTFRHGMPILQAADSYMRLTVGDGMVTQIPALLVSVAAGLLVSKTNTTGSTDKALFRQLSGYPSALGLQFGHAADTGDHSRHAVFAVCRAWRPFRLCCATLDGAGRKSLRAEAKSERAIGSSDTVAGLEARSAALLASDLCIVLRDRE